MSTQYLSASDIALIRKHADTAHASSLSSGGVLSNDEKKYFCLRCMNLSSAFAQKNPLQHIGCIYYHLRMADRAPSLMPPGAILMASDVKLDPSRQDRDKRAFMQALRDLGCVFPLKWGDLGYPTRSTPTGSPVALTAGAGAPTAGAAAAADAPMSEPVVDIDAREFIRQLENGAVSPPYEEDDIDELEDEFANDDDDDDDDEDDEDDYDQQKTESEPDPETESASCDEEPEDD